MPLSESELQEKQAIRYAMLRHLYEKSNGSPWTIVPFFNLAASFGVADDAARDAFDWLTGQRLIRPMTFGGGVSITHGGVLEVEASITRPNTDTEHFQPPTFNFYGPVGGIQSGGHDTMTVEQVATTGTAVAAETDLASLRPLLATAQPNDRVNAGVLLSAMEDEAGKISPNPSLIRAFGDALSRFLPQAEGDRVKAIVAQLTAA